MRRIIFGWIVLVGSVLCGLYVGGWLMFIKPILDVCNAFDAGTITGLLIGTAVLKCLFASVAGWLIVYVGAAVANRLSETAK